METGQGQQEYNEVNTKTGFIEGLKQMKAYIFKEINEIKLLTNKNDHKRARKDTKKTWK